MLFFKWILPALVFTCICQKLFSQLQVIPNSNAQALAQKLAGAGVTISNVSITGSPLSSALFRNQGSTLLGIDSGIVLSTGRVLTEAFQYGLNGSQVLNASNNLLTPGDSSLAALVSPQITNDAVILEFDFVPVGDTVKFRYVFSSEEYPQFNCTGYNDVFAFFISGPGITGAPNLALVPGTNIPVAINSINNGLPGFSGNITTCNAMGAGSPFTQYYVNNTGNNFFTHNGHTVVLTAKSAVQPCQTYHLKIAIADVQDASYDSGVFLEAGSLNSDPIRILNNLPVTGGRPYLVEGCKPGVIQIVRPRKSPVPQLVNLVYKGSATNGTDLQTLPSTITIPANDSIVFIPLVPNVDNIMEGNEILKIYVSNGCITNNFFLDSVLIEIREYDTLAISPQGGEGLCGNTFIQLNAGPGYASYQWSPLTGLNNASIPDPVAAPLMATTYICTAQSGDCHARDSVRIYLKQLELLSKKDIYCANETNGEIRISGGNEWQQPVQYSIGNGAFGSDSVFTQLAPGNYRVRIKDAGGCTDSLLVSIVQAYPNLVLADSSISASCSGSNGQVYLFASGGKLPYAYQVDANTNTTGSFIVNGGIHSLQVTDSNGCVASRSITINNDPHINFITTVNPEACKGNPEGMIYIHATGGSGNYSYSVDGTTFQQADSILVNMNNFTVTVQDDKSCLSSKPVAIPFNVNVFINVGNDTTICEGSSVQFNTSTTATDFDWKPDPGLSGLNTANPIATPSVTSVYYVAASRDICTVHDTITVNVLPAPVANAGADTSICVGKTIRLNGSGGVLYSWMPANLVSDPSLADPSIRPMQTMNYYLKVTDANGCKSLRSDSILVSVVPTVRAFAGRDTAVTIGQPLQLSGRDLGNSGASRFEWSPAWPLNDPFMANPVAVLDRDIKFTLTLTTAEGCMGTDDILVKVFQGPEIFVPTGFSPNGDGLNDVLKAIPVGMKEFRYFKVFNRWGELVFSTMNENKGWDGTIRGSRQATGSFVWMAEAVDHQGRVVVRKGVTNLLR